MNKKTYSHLSIGARVKFNTMEHLPDHIKNYIRRGICTAAPGDIGTVIAYTQDGLKAAVEFDSRIFEPYQDYVHDAHGRGKAYHCLYLPFENLVPAEGFKTGSDPRPHQWYLFADAAKHAN